jgi:hypothetical protein
MALLPLPREDLPNIYHPSEVVRPNVMIIVSPIMIIILSAECLNISQNPNMTVICARMNVIVPNMRCLPAFRLRCCGVVVHGDNCRVPPSAYIYTSK